MPLSRAWIENLLGRGLAEPGLLGLVVVLVLTGVLDLGQAYFADISVAPAATEGATYGATFPGKNEGQEGMETVASVGSCAPTTPPGSGHCH